MGGVGKLLRYATSSACPGDALMRQRREVDADLLAGGAVTPSVRHEHLYVIPARLFGHAAALPQNRIRSRRYLESLTLTRMAAEALSS